MTTIQSIAIVGGTHGNELTGIHTVQALRNPQLRAIHCPIADEFATQYFIANPRATKAVTRYIDDDLNRQFTSQRLSAQHSDAYESGLAKMLNHTLGPIDAPEFDLVIDIHNTTSAMGPTLIVLADSPFYRNMAGYLAIQMPEANILLEDEVEYSAHPYLCTLGKHGVMLELGAQPQGVSRSDIFEQCQAMLRHVLHYCQLNNHNKLPDIPAFSAYRLQETINFPCNTEQEINGLIHANLLDKDFEPVHHGDPIFTLFDGTDVLWRGEHTIYPHFINEAAYQQSQVAFATASKFIW